MINSNKTNKYLFLVNITIVITVLSQIETIRSVIRPVMYGLWVLLLVIALIKSRGQSISTDVFKYSAIYILFVLFCLLSTIISTNHMNSNFMRVLMIPLLVSVVASVGLKDIKVKEFVRMSKIYVLTALLFGIFIHISYFPSISNWLASRMYVFIEKNSAAQIWCVAIILIFYVIIPNVKNFKLIWYAILLYFLFLCGLSQCRTALLAIIIVALYYVIKSPASNKIKILLLLVIVGAGLLNLPAAQPFVRHILLLDKYKVPNLDNMSSGRIGYYEIALANLAKHPLFGTGKYYVDCMYICALVENGAIGFIIILSFWIKRVIDNFRLNKRYNAVSSFRPNLIIAITLFYFVESILEGYPPFGPGVSAFMFWLICNMSFSNMLTGEQNESN